MTKQTTVTVSLQLQSDSTWTAKVIDGPSGGETLPAEYRELNAPTEQAGYTLKNNIEGYLTNPNFPPLRIHLVKIAPATVPDAVIPEIPPEE